MRYKNDKNYTEFIEEIVREKEKINSDSEQLDTQVKNTKNVLKGILEPLGMLYILKDEKYKSGREKLFPIHFQILCKVLLEQERSHKEDFVYKIKNKKFENISDEEITFFLRSLEEEFDIWFEKLEFTTENQNYSETDLIKIKEMLDVEYDEIERDMIEDQTTEYIDNIDNLDNQYNTDDVKYLKTKFFIRQQKNHFIESMQNNIRYRIEIFENMKKIHQDIDLFMEERLKINEFKGKIVLLGDYDSETFGELSMDTMLISRGNENTFELNNKEKSTIVKNFSLNISKYLKFYQKCIDRYVEIEKDEIRRGERDGLQDVEKEFIEIQREIFKKNFTPYEE